MSGVKFGLIDVDRIINNMRIVKRDQGYELVIHERALAAIEDMLDARYKMYRWFTMHHTVVVTNELIKIAIDMMTSEDEEIGRLFHWSSYKTGYSTDDYILFKIIEKLNNHTSHEKYQVIRGLIDRRYMPISFFKSTLDYARFIAQVARKVSIHEDENFTRKRIIRFFKDIEHAEQVLRDRLQASGESISQCVIRQSAPQIKTYEPFVGKDMIYLYRTDRDKLGDLWSESGYFRKINEEWTNYRSLYLFYLIPGLTKKKFAKHKDQLLKIMIDEIAEFSALEK